MGGGKRPQNNPQTPQAEGGGGGLPYSRLMGAAGPRPGGGGAGGGGKRRCRLVALPTKALPSRPRPPPYKPADKQAPPPMRRHAPPAIATPPLRPRPATPRHAPILPRSAPIPPSPHGHLFWGQTPSPPPNLVEGVCFPPPHLFFPFFKLYLILYFSFYPPPWCHFLP